MHQLRMVRPASVGPAAVPSLPAGYSLRQLRNGEEKSYDDLFHLAFEDENRYGEIVEETLDGGFFVIEHLASRALVSSCLAMRGGGRGQLGWLVPDPAHARKGLGTIAAALATNRLLSEGYAEPFLGTEDFRSVAI